MTSQLRRVGLFAVPMLACLVLVGSYHRKAVAAEPAKLVIVKAFYGDLPDGEKTDVTEKVAGMVKDGALSVDATNDNFGDPAEGIVKKLRVDYTFDGKSKSKTVNEDETLTISATGE